METNFKNLILEGLTLKEKKLISNEAKSKGLKYAGWNWWKDSSGNITHKTDFKLKKLIKIDLLNKKYNFKKIKTAILNYTSKNSKYENSYLANLDDYSELDRWLKDRKNRYIYNTYI